MLEYHIFSAIHKGQSKPPLIVKCACRNKLIKDQSQKYHQKSKVFCPKFFVAPRRPWRGKFTPNYAVRAYARFFYSFLKICFALLPKLWYTSFK
jgi:hypothetical protein